MNISLESIIKQVLCAVLAAALTLLVTQTVVRTSGMTAAAFTQTTQSAATPAASQVS
jgi:hypothetical protein